MSISIFTSESQILPLGVNFSLLGFNLRPVVADCRPPGDTFCLQEPSLGLREKILWVLKVDFEPMRVDFSL